MKRDYLVILPDGTQAWRTSERVYSHAAVCFLTSVEGDRWIVLGYASSFELAEKASKFAPRSTSYSKRQVLPVYLKGHEPKADARPSVKLHRVNDDGSAYTATLRGRRIIIKWCHDAVVAQDTTFTDLQRIDWVVGAPKTRQLTAADVQREMNRIMFSGVAPRRQKAGSLQG